MTLLHRSPRMSMISGSGVITGGAFIQNNFSDGRKSPFEILKENVAHTAFHNSAARFDLPKCHPNTRVAVLTKIMDWIHRTDWETWYRYMLWLTGAAGAGKSAIAQSIIERCLVEGLVIASFFFFRSDSTRNHAKSLVATLAYQIILSVPSTRETMQAAIDHDPLIFTRNLEHQFELLVVQPLREFYQPVDKLDEKWRRVIVIDGLDECLDRHTQTKILNMLRDTIQKYELPVLFLIASRPEHEISTFFGSPPMNGVFARLYLDDTYDPDEDIRTFLRAEFEEIKATHPFKSHIPTIWPAPGAVESIVAKSSGQFIYAATAVRYVQSIRHQPHTRLEMILKLRQIQGDMPFSQLDKLYTMILSSAADIERVLYAISIFSLRVAPAADISGYMGLDDGELEILFCDLAALVTVGRNEELGGTTLNILHASLHDFLLDPMRSKGYFIGIEAYRTAHITSILQYIASTHFQTDKDPNDVNLRCMSTELFFTNNFQICEITPELIKQARAFPLDQVFNNLRILEDNYEIISFLSFGFLPLIRRMARLYPQWSLIEDRTRVAFDKFLLSYMSSYHNNNRLVGYLCLIYHLGHVEYVPGIRPLGVEQIFICDSDLDEPLPSDSSDHLLLRYIGFGKTGTDEDQYRQCILSFLLDPARSGIYAMGPDTYTKATTFSMNELLRIDLGEGWLTADETESRLISRVLFHDNLWQLNTSLADDLNFLLAFLHLGYIIFFLPRCGKSEQLLEYCQRQIFLPQTVTRFFPRRTSLVREAMHSYLERFGQE